MGKVLARGLSLIWLPLSVVVTAVALAHFFDLVRPGVAKWAQISVMPLDLYGKLVGTFFKPVGDFVQQQAAFAVPLWSADLAIAYISMASACAFAGATLTKHEQFVDGVRSSAASLGWPLALIMFAVNSARNRTVSRFAAEHTTLFVLYLFAVAGVIAAALYADRWTGVAVGA